jgi:predicted transcriptional regulator
MTTTTLRLPPDVRARIDKLAAAAGKTTHAFMVDALTESADRLEQQRAFDAEVARRWTRFQRSGEYLTLEDVRSYATALARGEKPARPTPRVKSPADMALVRAGAGKRSGR